MVVCFVFFANMKIYANLEIILLKAIMDRKEVLFGEFCGTAGSSGLAERRAWVAINEICISEGVYYGQGTTVTVLLQNWYMSSIVCTMC